MENSKTISALKKPVAVLLMVMALMFAVLWAAPLTAHAASQAQDGLEVTMTTDKGSYAAGEAVTVKVSITNTNAVDVNNIKLEMALPSGLSLKTGSATITINSLAAGATQTHSFAAVADAASSTPVSSTPAASTAQTGGAPQTGDDSGLILWVALLALSVGAAAVGFLLLKKRKSDKFLSVLLCFVLFSGLMAPALSVQAATTTKDFTVKESVTVGGAAKQITLKASYDWDDGIVAATGVSLDITSKTLSVGGTQQLTATVAPANASNKDVTWESSAPAVATVSSTGLVTAVADGTAVITVTTAEGGKTASCTITVASVTGVSLDITTITNFDKDSAQTQQLTATVAPANAANQNVTWGSSDSSIASVDASGLVTAVGVGTATITVTTKESGYTDTCAVTVGSKSASNAEAAMVSFMADTTKNDAIVQGFALNAPGLDAGTTLNYVSFEAGANAANAVVDTVNTRITNNDFYISTWYIVDAPDITYCGLTFSATLNGVTSDPVTLDVSVLFEAATTTGKLRTDKAMLIPANVANLMIQNGFSGEKTISLTLSSGVSISSQAASIVAPGGALGVAPNTIYISGAAGGAVIFNFGSAVSFGGTNGDVFFRSVAIQCDGTTYVISQIQIQVIQQP